MFPSSARAGGEDAMPTYSKEDILRYLGATPEEISRDLNDFVDAAKVLSSDHPRLIDEHPNEWVGIFAGHVAAAADNFDELMAQLSQRNIPADRTIVRFIDREEKTLLL
jgi:hypothetical protein